MPEVTIEQFEPQTVVALRHLGEYMDIGNTFERLITWAGGHNLLDQNTRVFAIYHDDPTVTPVTQLRSDTCITVSAGHQVEPGFEVRKTPGGRCRQSQGLGL